MDRRFALLVSVATVVATVCIGAPVAAQSLTGRLEMVGPGAARYQASIASQLATVLALDASPPTAPSALEVALRVRVQIVGRGRRAHAIVDVATGAGYPLLSRTVPGIHGELGTDVLAAAALDAVRDGAISLVQHERSRAREESLRRARDAEAARRLQRAEEEEDRVAAEARARDAVRLRTSGGVALRLRTLDVLLAGQDQLVHETGPYAELSLLVESRPFDAESGLLRGLYGELLAAAAVGLTALQEGGESLDVGAYRVLASAGYRYAIGPVEVGGAVGMGWESFALGKDALVPSTSIPYLRFGPSARLAILPNRLLSARVDAGMRLPFGVGELGDRFGPASALGYDVSAGVDGQSGRFVFGVHLGLSRFGLGWDEGASGGALPDGEEAVSATDSSLWAMATAGYRVY
ncbi:MAG: hypothetical protein IT379_22865 [Deltaproteobacteria bacterium]|nr:hypothetical protein [Deltaproteobacteria bacterium]